jgi:hypothetical protein
VGRRAGWPEAPATTPPFPFTEWPYGAATLLGVSRPNSVDSPLMVALANTGVGKWMNETGIQVYGWVNGGGNLRTNTSRPADTVQKDQLDWGFRFSALYGENYRYTNGYGYMSYQFNGHNLYYGYDFPMVYGELFVPFVADGCCSAWGASSCCRISRRSSPPTITCIRTP